ncbi:MAG: hypothetical protein WBH03_03350, partial [Cyclobacteriaceae bacterium]
PEQGSDFKNIRLHIGNKMSAPLLPNYTSGLYIKNNEVTSSSDNICYNENVDIELTAESGDNLFGIVWSGDYMWFYSDNEEKSFNAYGYSNSNPKTTHKLTKETVFYCFAKFNHHLPGFDAFWKYIGKKTISVYKQFDAGAISSTQTICYATSPAMLIGTSPTGGDGNYAYQWQSSVNNTTWVNISNAKGINYQPQNLTQSTYFKRVANNDCGSNESNTVLINVHNPLISGTLNSNQALQYNTLPSKLNGSTPTGGDGNYTYKWQDSEDNISWRNIKDASLSSFQPPVALIATTYYKRIVTDGCDSKESNVATITVHDRLSPGSISSNQTICYNNWIFR